MLSYLGLSFLIFALVFSSITIISYKIKNFFNNEKIFYYSIYFSFFSILLAFFLLLLSYIISDFSNLNVFNNSHSSKPLLYKITGVWGNHEGSMLLWLLVLSSYTLIFSYNKSLNSSIKKLTIVFQSALFICFCSFVLLTSNPFILNPIKVAEGLGLNPILQDPALAIHPPMLYIGYVGFSLILSLALSGIISDQLNVEWVSTLKKWSIFCWSMLTAGIALGSYWAYYELGWGGWWFWDPVENVSLMPWIAGLALVHSLVIAKKDQLLIRWIIFLSILCFSLSIMGTFLVRSGILTSVHTFATDASRGIFILILFLVITGFSFILFILNTSQQDNKLNLLFLNKTSSIIINNVIMMIACATVLLGTLYPILIEVLTNKRISVGAPYYNATVLPIMLPGFLLMSVAPALSWQTNKMNNSKYIIYIFIIISLISFLFNFFTNFSVYGFIGIFLGLWSITVSLFLFIKNNLLLSKNNLIKSIISGNALIAHLGVGLLIIGITVSSVYKTEQLEKFQVGKKITFNEFELKFDSINIIKKDNFQSLIGNFSLHKNNDLIANIYPEKRYYFVSKLITTEAGIYHHIFKDIYIVLGEQNNNEWSVKIYQNPLINLIWLGAIIMVFSGLLGLAKR